MTATIDTTAALAIDEAAADLLFRTARTTSQWTDAPVTDDELRAAWDLAKFGPTAMNSLPLRLAVVRSAEERARLVDLMPDGNKSRVASAPVTLVLAYDHNFHEHMDTLFPHAPGVGASFGPQEDLRHGMGSMNAHLQAGYLLVGLRAAGLAAGPMHAADYEGVNEAFFAGTGYKAFLVVNVGHADGEGTAYPRAPRFDLDQVSITL